jgi:fatty acid desaturase
LGPRDPVTDADESTRFVREAHGLVRDLLEPRPVRYWTDFLITIVAMYTALVVHVATDFSVLQVTALIVCALAMYRAVVFTHEIAHRPAGSFTGFAVVWNASCGIPLWMPSFLYGDHKSHHIRPAYGTRADPEYILLASRPRSRLLLFLSLALVYPVLGPLRFLLLTPLALIVPPLDRVIWTRASSLYNMNESYRRPYDAQARLPSRWLQELAACAWAWTVVGLVAMRQVSWNALGKVYLVFVFWIVVNQLRTLAAHRYTNRTGAPIGHFDQVVDTNTFGHGRWLPHLWAPLGMRYHALHHLLPAMPYHAMGRAHRRLMERLPPRSPYHATVKRSLWSVVAPMLLGRRPAGTSDRDVRAGSPDAVSG